MNPATTSTASGVVGAASGASVTLVIAIRTHDAMTMAAEAPRT
jgi:hypothetical protein